MPVLIKLWNFLYVKQNDCSSDLYSTRETTFTSWTKVWFPEGTHRPNSGAHAQECSFTPEDSLSL